VQVDLRVNIENFFSARNYSEFNVNEFIRLIKNKLEHNQDFNVSVRTNKFII